jgi:hypothetical protein
MLSCPRSPSFGCSQGNKRRGNGLFACPPEANEPRIGQVEMRTCARATRRRIPGRVRGIVDAPLDRGESLQFLLHSASLAGHARCCGPCTRAFRPDQGRFGVQKPCAPPCRKGRSGGISNPPRPTPSSSPLTRHLLVTQRHSALPRRSRCSGDTALRLARSPAEHCERVFRRKVDGIEQITLVVVQVNPHAGCGKERSETRNAMRPCELQRVPDEEGLGAFLDGLLRIPQTRVVQPTLQQDLGRSQVLRGVAQPAKKLIAHRSPLPW